MVNNGAGEEGAADEVLGGVDHGAGPGGRRRRGGLAGGPRRARQAEAGRGRAAAGQRRGSRPGRRRGAEVVGV